MTRHRIGCKLHWLICAAVLALSSCATKVHYINEQMVEDKVGRLKIGQTTRTDADNLFGRAVSHDRFRRIYQLSDTEEGFREQLNNSVQEVIPAFIDRAPANTRAIISLWFNDGGLLKRYSVERFFERPYVNDYWYSLNDSDKAPLETVSKLADSQEITVVDKEKTAASLKLAIGGTQGHLDVQLADRVLRMTSRNPHDRLASEYRLFIRRETELVNSVNNSKMID